MPEIELRPLDDRDLFTLHRWRNDPKNRRFFREYRPITLKQHTTWFERLQDDRSTQMFAIGNGTTLVGVCGLTGIDWINRSAEISLYIGQGYIDEVNAPIALRLLEQYADDALGLHRLWAEIWGFDATKQALLTKAGYTLEVTRRQAHWDKGWYNALIYAKLLGE